MHFPPFKFGLGKEQILSIHYFLSVHLRSAYFVKTEIFFVESTVDIGKKLTEIV